MSNEWNLLCRTCDEKCYLEWNNGGDKIQDLIPHLPAIAKMGPATEIISERFDFWFPNGLLSFAESHHDHDLIGIDEYGVLYGDCGNRYTCGCCGTWVQCRRPRGHDGDHGPKEGQ